LLELRRRGPPIGLVLNVRVVRHAAMMILRWDGVLRLVVCVWVHVVVIHGRRRLVMLLLMLLLLVRLVLMLLIVRASPVHIMLHTLPCRQRTSVHHAGLGGRVQFDV
jgi:hypothetical protein